MRFHTLGSKSIFQELLLWPKFGPSGLPVFKLDYIRCSDEMNDSETPVLRSYNDAASPKCNLFSFKSLSLYFMLLSHLFLRTKLLCSQFVSNSKATTNDEFHCMWITDVQVSSFDIPWGGYLVNIITWMEDIGVFQSLYWSLKCKPVMKRPRRCLYLTII